MKAVIDGMTIEGTPQEIAEYMEASMLRKKRLDTIEKTAVDREPRLVIIKTPAPIPDTPAPAAEPEPRPEPQGDYVTGRLSESAKKHRLGAVGQRWSADENDIVREVYKKYRAPHGKLLSKGKRVLCNKLPRREWKAIRYHAMEMGCTSGMFKRSNHPLNKDSKFLVNLKDKTSEPTGAPVPAFVPESSAYMLRKKAVLPTEVLGKTIAATIQNEEPFPGIFPLTTEACEVFRSVLEEALGSKRDVQYKDVQYVLQLKEGHEWSGREWRDFCTQVLYNLPKIAKAMDISQRLIRVTKNDLGYHVIRCY